MITLDINFIKELLSLALEIKVNDTFLVPFIFNWATFKRSTNYFYWIKTFYSLKAKICNAIHPWVRKIVALANLSFLPANSKDVWFILSKRPKL